ncbi:dihydrofolate reductase family protein [Leifsonia shinshuensis]|uniref:dihydrofolate reductase family protein n=1 Tax=Leifsonia shinshuensis TaxID=150026 RepID=UPI0028587CF4|nr:dihydrofolate reductase family protein [Leifsonia shinshuensis]MDR6972723.1 dihydrofolate reductase [Leifsonia shinshuensis]
MAELMIDYITSLDGYGSAEGWPGLWGMGGPEYFEFLAEDARERYTLLMGSRTYRLFQGFAETGEEDVSSLTDRQKIVFSRTLTEPLGWENTAVVNGDAVEAVRQLKQGDVPLRTLGSPSLCRSLLSAGLVDRYRVVVFPVVNGVTGADRIYDGWPDVVLQTTGLRTFDSRLQLFEGVPTHIGEGPPSGP